MKRLFALTIVSLFLLVLVGCDGEVTLSAPENITITATTDGLGVILDWDEVTDEIDGYYVYFETAAIGTVTTAGYTDASPSGTGDYYVTAYLGEDESDPSTTVTTTPVHTATVTIYELEASGNAGYGWDLAGDMTGSTYSMADAANDVLVDFYISNWVDDPLGGPWPLNYRIETPTNGVSDPGGVVPAGNWRTTWFSDPITDPQAPLPAYSSTTYFDWTEIDVDPIYIAFYLDDEGYFGLTTFSGANATDGSIQVETWIQPVPELRLIEH